MAAFAAAFPVGPRGKPGKDGAFGDCGCVAAREKPVFDLVAYFVQPINLIGRSSAPPGAP